MSLISDFGAGSIKKDVHHPKFNNWEKQGYKSLSKKLSSSTLGSRERREIDGLFKQELLGGKTRSNSQILEIVKKKYGSGAALKIKESLTPKAVEGLTDAEKRVNVRLGKQSSRLASKNGDDKVSNPHFANQGSVKRLSSDSKTGFAGYSNPDQKVTEGVDQEAGAARRDLFSGLK